MIYFVSKQKKLFASELYKEMTLDEAIKVIESFNVIQFDIETIGKDPHIGKLLLAQFGNKAQNIQIVVDCTTIDILVFKNVLEKKFIIGQNLKFDLQFLYNYSIIPLIIYDTMIVEQLLYLGYPPYGKEDGISYSLAAIAKRYLNIDIDKSIRGQIIWKGIDESVIIYAANDVKWLEDIKEHQISSCRYQGCLIGAKLECDFVPVIAYLEWCGIRLDTDKWLLKMTKNQNDLIERKLQLDSYVETNDPDKFCNVNIQGDLFNGFNTEPKCNINWGSSKQVISYVKHLGFNTVMKDKSTGLDKDSVIEKLLKGQKGINDEFLKIYFDYKEAEKVCSTYGQNYIDAINPITDRIHTVFKQLGATSGRMSCGDGKNKNKDLANFKGLLPNDCDYVQLQNLPADEETRASFIPKEGNIMCSCDYAALELINLSVH